MKGLISIVFFFEIFKVYGQVEFRARVTDSDKNPLSGIVIQFSNGNKAKSNSDGTVYIRLSNRTYDQKITINITPQKGYQAFEKKLLVLKHSYIEEPFNIILLKKGERKHSAKSSNKKNSSSISRQPLQTSIENYGNLSINQTGGILYQTTIIPKPQPRHLTDEDKNRIRKDSSILTAYSVILLCPMEDKEADNYRDEMIDFLKNSGYKIELHGYFQIAPDLNTNFSIEKLEGGVVQITIYRLK